MKKLKKNINILSNVKNHFENNNNMEFLSVKSESILVRKDKVISETIVTNDAVKFKDTDYIRTQGVYANKKFLEKMDYKFLQGSIEGFNLEKDADYIPVVLGYIYKDKYKVGDTIEVLKFDYSGKQKKSEMKVIAILDKDNYLYEDGILAKGQSLNNAMVVPYDEISTWISNFNEAEGSSVRVELANYLKGGYVVLNNNVSVDKINKDLLDYELKYQLKDLNKSMEEYKNDVIEQLKPVIYMSIIVMLFSMISVVIVMINAIVKDKKEFGINIMIGATMRDIRIRVLGQVFLLLGISIVISTIILKSFGIFRFNIVDFSLSVGVMLGVLIIISVIILVTLNKYSINDLIRRNE